MAPSHRMRPTRLQVSNHVTGWSPGEIESETNLSPALKSTP